MSKITRAKKNPAPAADANAPAKEAKEKAPRAPRTSVSRKYKILKKDNPFRADTRRGQDGRWDLILANKETGPVQAENKRCGKAFFDELAARGIIEFVD